MSRLGFRKLEANVKAQGHVPPRLAVDLALRETGTLEGAAQKLGVHVTTLRNWLADEGLRVKVVKVAMVVKAE
jgi:hypothetical protein